ncbi:MAG: hypothetical protein EHM63_02290 [Actinobacteria bacterium]|nr:MAG: hypothetical protein EHM63_02290 [Actinomycetota bacterium]
MQERAEHEMTAWVGWSFFAAVVLILVGAMNIITGFIALFDDNYLINTAGGMFVFDPTGWGFTVLIIGVLLVLAGFSILKGSLYGRIIGVLAAGLSAIAQISTIRPYPIWSMIVIFINVMVIYALTVHGDELKPIT